MKEIKKEKVEYYNIYEAVDGTIFDNREECVKYENSALGVLKGRFFSLIVGKENAWETIGGYDDNDVVAVKMSSDKDLETVLHFYYLQNSYYLRENKYKEEFDSKVISAYQNGYTLLFGINTEGEYYFIDSIQSIINKLNKISNG